MYLVVVLLQIFDAGDFSVLCSITAPRGERWMAGDFLAADRVILWSDEGHGYLYKLPAKYVLVWYRVQWRLVTVNATDL